MQTRDSALASGGSTVESSLAAMAERLRDLERRVATLEAGAPQSIPAALASPAAA